MARVPLTELIFAGTSPVRPAARKSVEILKRGTSTKATLFAAETGGATVAQPITTDSTGHPVAPGGTTVFVEEGSYDISVSGLVTPWEATKASVAAPKNAKEAPYNAVGDGVTDDRVAIQSALDDAASAGGGLVYLPAGTYLVKGSLEIDNFVMLWGAGWHTTIIKLAKGQNSQVLKSKRLGAGGETGGTEYTTIHNIGFDGNFAENGESTVPAVDLDGIRPIVERVFIKNGFTNLRSRMTRNKSPGTSKLEDGIFRDIGLLDPQAFNFQNEGPHDSQVDGVLGRSNDGINFGSYGVAMVWKNCHAYGNCEFGYDSDGGDVFVDCVGEGAEKGQVRFLGDSNKWLGGWLFNGGGADGGKGFILGDATHSVFSTTIEAVRIENTQNGAFIWGTGQNGAGSRITGWVTATSGKAIPESSTTPSSSVYLDLMLRGGIELGKSPEMLSNASTENLTISSSFHGQKYIALKISGAAEIKTIAARAAGQQVTLIFTSTAKLIDGGNLILAGNFEGVANRTITLVCDGTNWFECSRSTN